MLDLSESLVARVLRVGVLGGGGRSVVGEHALPLVEHGEGGEGVGAPALGEVGESWLEEGNVVRQQLRFGLVVAVGGGGVGARVRLQERVGEREEGGDHRGLAPAAEGVTEDEEAAEGCGDVDGRR